MNRDVLTLMGCSSSVALVLLTVNAADAAEIVPQHLGGSTTSSHSAQTVGVSLTQEYSSYSSLDTLDQEGDRALSIFGCNCNSCRDILRQMREQATLRFPG